MGHDLRALYGGCYRRLVGQVFALTRDIADAEECVRSAFVEAILARFRFRRRDDPEAWLRTAALRIARRRRRKHPIVQADLPNSTATAVLDAVQSLATGDREVAALGVIAELPATEIATLTGSSPSRIEARLTRSRKHLDDVDFGLPLPAAVRETRIWVEQSVDPGPFDDLRKTARRRRQRRGLVGAAAVLVVAAASISVPVVVRNHEPGQLESITQIKYVNQHEAYALLQPCEHGSCSIRIAHTTDGGQHWNSISVPHGPLQGMGGGMALGVCCGDRLSVSYTRPATPAEKQRHDAGSGGTIHIHAVSHDGGKHWTSGRDNDKGLRVGPQTAVVPDGWIPLTDYGMDIPTVVAVNSVDEVERPLQHQPDLVGPDVSVPFRQNGRIWAIGGTTRGELAYSDDEGASWHTMAAPHLPQGATVAAIFPRPGGSAYLETRLAGGRNAGPTYRLDKQKRWTELPKLGLGKNAIPSAVLPNGEMWISDPQYSTWRTRGNGGKAVKVTGPQLDGATVKLALAGITPDGVLYAMEPEGGRQDVVFSSRDNGAHWTVHEIRLPHNSEP